MSDVTPAPKGIAPDADTLLSLIDDVLNGDLRHRIPVQIADLLRWCRRRIGEQEAQLDLLADRILRAHLVLSEGDPE